MVKEPYKPTPSIPLGGFSTPRQRWYRSLGRGPWVWHDGRFVPEDQPLFTAEQWIHAADNALTLPALAYGTQLRLAHVLFDALQRQAELVGIPFPSFLTQETLQQVVTRLLNKNRYFGRVHLQCILFNQPVDVSPSDSALWLAPLGSLLITSRNQGASLFTLQEPWRVALYGAGKRSDRGEQTGIRPLTDTLAYQAARLLRLKPLHEVILLNAHGRIASGLQSQVYVIPQEGTYALTPSMEEGGWFDPLQTLLPQALASLGVHTVKRGALTLSQLFSAKHVLMASSSVGVQRVLGVDDRRYYLPSMEPVIFHLNQRCFPEQRPTP